MNMCHDLRKELGQLVEEDDFIFDIDTWSELLLANADRQKGFFWSCQ